MAVTKHALLAIKWCWRSFVNECSGRVERAGSPVLCKAHCQ